MQRKLERLARRLHIALALTYGSEVVCKRQRSSKEGFVLTTAERARTANPNSLGLGPDGERVLLIFQNCTMVMTGKISPRHPFLSMGYRTDSPIPCQLPLAINLE